MATDFTCCICGCTDITACHGRDGLPCYWFDDNLCSACEEVISDDVVREVGEERRRQDLRRGGPENDDLKENYDWAVLIQRLEGEAFSARARNDFAEYRRVMIQVAAVAVAAVQSIDRLTEGAT